MEIKYMIQGQRKQAGHPYVPQPVPNPPFPPTPHTPVGPDQVDRPGTTPAKKRQPDVANSSTQTSASLTQQDVEMILEATCVPVTTSLNEDEVAKRKTEACLWVGSVRRDIYNILLNPSALNPSCHPDANSGAVLVGKKSSNVASDCEMNVFAFLDRASLEGTRLPPPWHPLNDAEIVNAIEQMGQVDSLSLAVLKAFKKYLQTRVAKWTSADVAQLSIPFLICFRTELTPSLELGHRIRSRQLTHEELNILGVAPYAQFVEQKLVGLYQK